MIIIMFLLFNTLFFQKEEIKKFNYESQIGVVDVSKQDGLCLNIANNNLLDESNLLIVDPLRPQRLVKARVLKKLPNSCSLDHKFPQNNSSYKVELLGKAKDELDLVSFKATIGVIGITKPAKFTKGIVSVDLDGDGKGELFKSCTSHEGIHLTVWSGQLFKGKRKRRWHQYYYLGYDVEPSCKARDF